MACGDKRCECGDNTCSSLAYLQLGQLVGGGFAHLLCGGHIKYGVECCGSVRTFCWLSNCGTGTVSRHVLLGYVALNRYATHHHLFNHATGGTRQRAASALERQVHAPCFAVEVAELAVLGHDLAGVNLGVVGEDVLPPLLLVHLLQMNAYGLLVLLGLVRTRA